MMIAAKTSNAKDFPLKYFILLSLVSLLAFGCKSKSADQSAEGGKRPSGPPPVFNAVLASRFAVDRKVQAPGSILPNENTDLHPEASGRVVAINFKEGTYVKAGTLLVKLFDDDLQAQLKKLTVQLQVAEATERRQKELLALNGTSQQDYDLAVLSVSNIKADMELIKVNIDKTEMRAPYDGRLGLRTISLGAYVTPQTIITNIAQLNQVKVEFSVPELYATEMQTGKKVMLRTSGGSKYYSATVMASQNTINEETRNLVVKALINNPDATLTPGSFVEVDIEVGKNQSAIMIPTQAVIPSTRFKNVIVAQGGKATFRIVNTGYRDSARIEITSRLKEGDTIITTGLLTIKEGMPIKAKLSN